MVRPSSQKPLHPSILEIFKMFPEGRKNLLSFAKHLGLEWQVVEEGEVTSFPALMSVPPGKSPSHLSWA